MDRTFPPAAFIIALACFLLPFVELACQGQRLAVLTGVQLAIGTSVQVPQMFGPPKERTVPADGLVLSALAVSVLGLILAVNRKSSMAMPAAACGAIVAVLLLIFKVRSDRSVLAESAGLIELRYGLGFWEAVAASAGGSILAYLGRDQPVPATALPHNANTQ